MDSADGGRRGRQRVGRLPRPTCVCRWRCVGGGGGGTGLCCWWGRRGGGRFPVPARAPWEGSVGGGGGGTAATPQTHPRDGGPDELRRGPSENGTEGGAPLRSCPLLLTATCQCTLFTYGLMIIGGAGSGRFLRLTAASRSSCSPPAHARCPQCWVHDCAHPQAGLCQVACLPALFFRPSRARPSRATEDNRSERPLGMINAVGVHLSNTVETRGPPKKRVLLHDCGRVNKDVSRCHHVYFHPE